MILLDTIDIDTFETVCNDFKALDLVVKVVDSFFNFREPIINFRRNFIWTQESRQDIAKLGIDGFLFLVFLFFGLCGQT